MNRLHNLQRLRVGAASIFRNLLVNLPIAVVAIVLAAMLWIAVTNEENPTVRRELPFQVSVEKVNVPRSYVVTGTNPERVNVTLVGARNRIGGIRPEDLSVRVDLSGAATAGTAPGQPLRFNAPTEVSVRGRGVQAEALPQTVELTLEPEVRRSVLVRVNTVGSLPIGFDLAEPPSAQPVQAVIVGAKQNVDLVASASADLKLDGLTVNIDKSLSLDPRDSAGHSIGHVSVEPADATVNVKVKQVLFTRQLLVDPRVRGRPAPGYVLGSIQAQPALLGASGSFDALNQASSLSTQDIDVEGATSDVIRTVSIQTPPGVNLTDPKASIVVKVGIQPQNGPGSIGVTPRVIGLGPGLSVVLQSPTVVVNISGPLPALLRLAPSDVAVTVDANGLSAGAYRLDPKVALPPGIQLDGVVPDRVGVIVNSR
jgi:YbbR domain-containing protein